MECLVKQLDELKLVLNNPKLYLVDYFSKLRSRIDLECQVYLNKGNVKDSENAIKRQQEMISQVDQFQEECLSHLETIACDLTDLEMFEQRLENLDFEETVATLQLERAIYCALYARKKLLFRNKGIIFLSKSSHNYYQKYLGEVVVGSLFIIEDEFLLYSEKFKQIEDVKQSAQRKHSGSLFPNIEDEMQNDSKPISHMTYDWCHEILRIHFGIVSFVNELHKDKVAKAVYRIQLNYNQESLYLEWPQADSSDPQRRLSDLPALKRLGLVHGNLKKLSH